MDNVCNSDRVDSKLRSNVNLLMVADNEWIAKKKFHPHETFILLFPILSYYLNCYCKILVLQGCHKTISL